MSINASLRTPFAPFDIGTGPHVPDAGILETGRIPAANYVCPDFHQREIDHIFKKTWLNVALTHELPRPGDYIVRNILGASVLLVRGRDHIVRAFHNVCPHRGTQIAWADKGHAANFTCRYHAWSFSTEGSLLRVPDEAHCFDRLDKSQVGLSPIACEVYGPWVYITFNRQRTLTLRQFLGGWADRFDGLPWDEFTIIGRISRELNCNWKFGIDANSEGYHIRALHGRTVATQLLTQDNPFARSLGHYYIGAHHEYIVPFNPDYQRDEKDIVYCFGLRQAVQLSMSKMDERATRSKTAGELAFATHRGINIDNHPLFSQDSFIIFPNSAILIGRHGWFTAQFYPLGHDRCFFYADYGFRHPKSMRERFAREQSMMFYRDILIEDLLTMERQQIALTGGGKQYVQVTQQEMLIRHHHACIQALIDAGEARRTSASQKSSDAAANRPAAVA